MVYPTGYILILLLVYIRHIYLLSLSLVYPNGIFTSFY
nr:MAG TPA: hypothetical protein [Myoviridae sp. ctNPX13]